MCVAIYKPKGTAVKKADMRLAYERNSDGCGFAVRRKNGDVSIHKGLWTFEQWWHEYAPYQDAECLLHFRFATAGGITPAMCHPFRMANGAMVHNGHMHGYGSKNMSDTMAWSKGPLGALLARNPALVEDTDFLGIVAESIGESNKVLLMLPGYPVAAIGKFYEENGILYSNHYYRVPQVKKTTYTVVDRYTDTCHIPSKGQAQGALWGKEFGQDATAQDADEAYFNQLAQEAADHWAPGDEDCEVCHTEDSARYIVCQHCYDNAVDMLTWNK